MTSRLLRDEARAWRDLPPDAYDAAVCELLDGMVTGPLADLVVLASATLRRTGLTVTESRGRAARYLLDLADETRDPALRARARLLVLLAWLRLGATIAAGPDSVTVAPESPPGVVLPAGADPASITDPRAARPGSRLGRTARRGGGQVERQTARAWARPVPRRARRGGTRGGRRDSAGVGGGDVTGAGDARRCPHGTRGRRGVIGGPQPGEGFRSPH